MDLPDREHTHLIYIYSKDEADDVSFESRKIIRELVRKIKEVKHGKNKVEQALVKGLEEALVFEQGRSH